MCVIAKTCTMLIRVSKLYQSNNVAFCAERFKLKLDKHSFKLNLR